jgi:aspartyl aminopeptidase
MTRPSPTSPPHAAASAASDPSLGALMAYLDASPSPFHAVANARTRLEAAGFTELSERDAWTVVSGRHFVVRGGALVAWVANDTDPTNLGVHIVGAHTDSPNLRVKPRPDVANVGWRQLAVEIYGGVLANSWLDRDLGLSGRLVLLDGTTRLVLVDRPIARVAQLAIHLDREVNDKGLVLDKQSHLLPLIGLGTSESGDFLRWLAAETGAADIDPEGIVGTDLMLHDLTPAATLGVDDELLASGRIDNLFSAWAATEALCDIAETTGRVAVIALFDHEEIGSESTTGAAGPFLESALDRLLFGLGVNDPDARGRTLAASTCVSSDMAHSVHPNYAERHEPGHRPIPNAGPVVKVNANQRYATDSVSAAMFTAACERAGVPHQVFVSRNSQPCGSTIGPITATRLGISTVDVGCAMLSMHSARELCGANDADVMRRALSAYLGGR